MSQQVLPFYLLCDESASMSGEPLNAINASLPDLHKEIGSNPAVADKTRFCLIGFSSRAEVLLPLSDMSTVTSMPTLSAGGGTSYGEAFQTLYRALETDVAQLKSDGHQVYRPTVFFLSDGYPNDEDWQADYQTVVDPGWRLHPNILAFGFGQADEAIIRQVATTYAFMADGSLSPAKALREFARSLIQSIVSSGKQSAADTVEGATLVIPEQVEGFTKIPVDPV